MREAIARAIKRLNLQSVVMNLPVFGQALYDGLSEEFNRVNDYKDIIKHSVVANDNMSIETLDDYEKKYGLRTDPLFSDAERVNKIIERASRNGNGGAEWLQKQIRLAGFDLYVIVNTVSSTTGAQFGDFQFGSEQFGGITSYIDPRGVPGEIVASSSNGNNGGQFISFGDFQFGSQVQFGTLQENSVYPAPKPFVVPFNPDSWAYVFFVSPFPDRLATEIELQALSDSQLQTLKKIIIELKHAMTWAIVQVTTATLQKKITSDGLYKLTSDELTGNVLSDL
jgi:hypothetical protein